MKTLTFFSTVVLVVIISISTFSGQPSKVHMVKPGDTLWDISAFYLQNPILWPSIYQANEVKIEDPHWIYPGQSFMIPPLMKKTERVYFQPGPKKEEKEETETKASIEAANLMVASQLAYKGGFITDDKIEEGYIVESEPKKKENLVSDNTVYIDLGSNDGIAKGDLFTIFRYGRGLKDPATGRHLGRIVDILGKLVVQEVAEDASSCKIIQSFDIIKNHDMIKPYIPMDIPQKFELSEPETVIEGNLVATKKERKMIYPFDIIYINLGEADGISIGDYFDIIREGEEVSDPGPKGKVELPELKAGGLQVLRTTNETSTCYITEINGNMDIEPGEMIRLKGKGPHVAIKHKVEEEGVFEEEGFEVIEEEEEEEIIGPE